MEGFSHVDDPPSLNAVDYAPPGGRDKAAKKKKKKLVPNSFARCDSGVSRGTVQIEVIFREIVEKKKHIMQNWQRQQWRVWFFGNNMKRRIFAGFFFVDILKNVASILQEICNGNQTAGRFWTNLASAHWKPNGRFVINQIFLVSVFKMKEPFFR